MHTKQKPQPQTAAAATARGSNAPRQLTLGLFPGAPGRPAHAALPRQTIPSLLGQPDRPGEGQRSLLLTRPAPIL